MPPKSELRQDRELHRLVRSFPDPRLLINSGAICGSGIKVVTRIRGGRHPRSYQERAIFRGDFERVIMGDTLPQGHTSLAKCPGTLKEVARIPVSPNHTTTLRHLPSKAVYFQTAVWEGL